MQGSSLDAMFTEINKFPLTAKVSTKIAGKSMNGINELPLISQSIANSIATVAWGISSPRGQSNIQRTIEISVKRKFLPYINSMARSNPKMLHHMYEWGQVGNSQGRLFDLVIPPESRGRANFSMKVNFRQSKKLVPLTEAQSTPGPTGQVVKKAHRFFNKAMVMEYGQTVHIRPLGDRAMAFDNNADGAKWGNSFSARDGLIFSRGTVVIDYSNRPTYHGFQTALKTFFSTTGKKDVGDNVGAYARKVTRSAGKAAHMINVAVPSDEYANQVAKKYTDSLGVII